MFSFSRKICFRNWHDFRYDLNANKIFISVRATKESNIDCGTLMKELINGEDQFLDYYSPSNY